VRCPTLKPRDAPLYPHEKFHPAKLCPGKSWSFALRAHEDTFPWKSRAPTGLQNAGGQNCFLFLIGELF